MRRYFPAISLTFTAGYLPSTSHAMLRLLNIYRNDGTNERILKKNIGFIEVTEIPALFWRYLTYRCGTAMTRFKATSLKSDFAYCVRCYRSVVCLSVCLSRSCIALKRQKIWTWFLLNNVCLPSVNPFLLIFWPKAPCWFDRRRHSSRGNMGDQTSRPLGVQ